MYFDTIIAVGVLGSKLSFPQCAIKDMDHHGHGDQSGLQHVLQHAVATCLSSVVHSISTSTDARQPG